MKKNKKIKLKRGPVFKFIKKIVRCVKRKPEIIDLNTEEIADNAIFIANHSAASGPFTYELFFPKYFVPWGTHEMCENYFSRWKYLYHIFYRTKLHYGKFRSAFLATFFGIISKKLYKATGLIGTYKDVRLISTFKQSFEVLDNNSAILIFPENSDAGYFEELKEFNKGFITLSKIYHKKHNRDLPVYNIYYSKKHKKMVISKPVYINKMLESGMKESEIAETLLTSANLLYKTYIVQEKATA